MERDDRDVITFRVLGYEVFSILAIALLKAG